MDFGARFSPVLGLWRVLPCLDSGMPLQSGIPAPIQGVPIKRTNLKLVLGFVLAMLSRGSPIPSLEEWTLE